MSPNASYLLKRLCAVLPAAVLALSCSSCGGPKGLYPVQGKLLYKGKPAEGAEVIFHPEGDDTATAIRPMGMVQEDGTFKLTSFGKGDGAPAGKYYVFVRWLETETPEVKKVRKRKIKDVPADIFKGRYQDHKRPPFRVEIMAGSNELPPFELKD
jgi:hypothetical protein